MRRRTFIALFGGAAAWPLAARGEQPAGTRRIVLLMRGADDPELQKALAAFRQELGRLGWAEGRDIRFEIRFTVDAGRFQSLAREAVASRPDIILVQTTPFVAAVRRESDVIPIVFISVSDPVGSGFIASLARPGGNVTGLLLYEEGITGKWLAMLKEIAPRIKRVAVVANPKDTPFDYFLRSARLAAQGLGIELVANRVENLADITQAIESCSRLPDGGLVFLPSSTMISYRDAVIALAAKYRLPAVYPLRLFVTGGGLMSYDVDRVDQFSQAASYADRILRGAKPADLPVQAPTKYETVVNVKAAKAIGLEVPASLLVRADEVIE